MQQNNILIASGNESRTDVISSIFVLISSILIAFSNYVGLFKYSDKIAGIIVGIFIVITGYKIIKENTTMLMGQKADDKDLREKLESYSDILKIDDIVLIKYGPYYRAFVEITMDFKLLKDAHDKAHEIENEIKKEIKDIEFINIHINPK